MPTTSKYQTCPNHSYIRSLRLAVLSILSICSLAVASGQRVDRRSYGDTPFGQKSLETRQVSFEVGSGAVLTPEHRMVLRAIWDDLSATHSYSEDGEIVQGAAGERLVDRPDIHAAVLRWIHENPVTKSVVGEERCQVCPGSGVIIVYESRQKLDFARVPCRACSGTGKQPVEIVYTVTCPFERLPERGKTPRQIAHEKLEASAASGDVAARLKLASVYRTGSKAVPPSPEKAHGLYLGLASEGNLDGLRGYALISKDRAVRDAERRFAVLLGRLWSVLSRSDLLTIDEPDATPLDEVEMGALLDKAAELYVGGRREFLKGGLTALLGELDLSNQSALRVVVVGRLKSGSTSFGSDAVRSLSTQAAGLGREAFAVLGAISEKGLAGPANPQAAHVYYSIALSLGGEDRMRQHVDRVAGGSSSRLTNELLATFAKFRPKGGCPVTFVESVFNITPEPK